jgi:hypothetical protein
MATSTGAVFPTVFPSAAALLTNIIENRAKTILIPAFYSSFQLPDFLLEVAEIPVAVFSRQDIGVIRGQGLLVIPE